MLRSRATASGDIEDGGTRNNFRIGALVWSHNKNLAFSIALSLPLQCPSKHTQNYQKSQEFDGDVVK